MTLTVTALKPDGTEATGPGGSDVPKYVSQGSTRAKVQASVAQTGNDTGTRYETVGGVSRPILMGALHIPVSAPCPTGGLPGRGWEYLVTAIGTFDDPALLARRYRVVSAPAKSHATARRLDVVEVT